MLFPSKEALARAAALQRGSFNEANESSTDASPHAVAIATVHARQDIVLLVSLQLDLHRQLVTISRGVWLIAILLIAWLLQHAQTVSPT